jgi:2,4-dienoyl-CoA reductase (NADPH2)
VDVRDVLEGRATPGGDVLVVDELGFHQATSVAELLADRGCRVRISTPGMVVGQDLGVTLDLELFTVRARNKGIRQTTDEVVMSASVHESGGVVLQILTHTTGAMSEVRVDWVVCAVHQEPADELWQELKGAPFEVHRAGDCLTPRRAHAAVIEGDRVGGAL